MTCTTASSTSSGMLERRVPRDRGRRIPLRGRRLRVEPRRLVGPHLACRRAEVELRRAGLDERAARREPPARGGCSTTGRRRDRLRPRASRAAPSLAAAPPSMTACPRAVRPRLPVEAMALRAAPGAQIDGEVSALRRYDERFAGARPASARLTSRCPPSARPRSSRSTVHRACDVPTNASSVPNRSTAALEQRVAVDAAGQPP